MSQAAMTGTAARPTAPTDVQIRLRGVFVTEASARLERLGRALPGVVAGSTAAARTALADVHAIAGNAGVVGEPELGWAAHACEELIAAFAAAEDMPPPVLDELAVLLDAVVARLAALVQAA